MRLVVLLTCLLAFLLPACDDEGGNDTSATTPDATVDADVLVDGGTGDVCEPWQHTPMDDPLVADAGDDATCELGPGIATVTPAIMDDTGCSMTSLQGKTLAVNALVLEKPDVLFLLDALNPLWQQDIENGTLIILFNIVAHDLDTGRITVETGAGAYTDCANYSWYTTPTIVELQTDGCAFTTVEPSQLAIFPKTMSKAIIISNLEIGGVFDPATGNMPGAWLEGTLREVDTEGLEAIELEVLVSELFIASGALPNADTDCDGEVDAWRLGGMLASTPITNVAF